MPSKKLNKKIITTLRLIYKLGLLKTLLLALSFTVSAEEIKIKWKGHFLTIRKHSTDFIVFREIFVFNQYKIKLLNNHKADIIVDLGANIGLSVLYFKSQYPDAKIIAIEPEKRNFSLLHKNVGSLPDVHCMNNAIWNSSRQLGIYDVGLGEYGYVINEEQEDEIESVKSITLTEIIEQFKLEKIDILKIDIEGSEKELFSENFEAWLPYVKSIIIELHDWFRTGCGSSFFRAVSKYDYTIAFKGENVIILFDQQSIPEKLSLVNGKQMPKLASAI